MLYVLIIDVQRVLYYCLLHEKSISISNANNIYINKRNYMCVKSRSFFFFIENSLFIFYFSNLSTSANETCLSNSTFVACGAISLSVELIR